MFPHLTVRHDPADAGNIQLEYYPPPDTWIFVGRTRRQLREELEKAVDAVLQSAEIYDETVEKRLRAAVLLVLLRWVGEGCLEIPQPATH